MNKNILNILNELGVPTHVASSYISKGLPVCSSSSGIVDMPQDVKYMMQALKTNMFGKDEIYSVIISHMLGCDVVDFLVCPYDKQRFGLSLENAKIGFALTYCWNRTLPHLSEPGVILVEYNPHIGALARIV